MRARPATRPKIKALEIGAKGYIIKQNFESILPSIKAVFAGQTVFGEYITTKLPQFLKENKKNNLSDLDLSDKDYSIIKLIAEGLNNKEISQRLYIGEGTVRNNISSILEKLNLRDRTQIAIYYYKNM
jgi:DNA-binding NarL/FixJ family response regulator